MTDPIKLLARLEEIGLSLARSEDGLALIGLGSVGEELDRLDAFSDLDFFVIVEKGSKAQYLSNLGWLNRIQPVVYAFQNTGDGYKLLFEDGIFCEFAVFELDELSQIPFTAGRIVWKKEGVADTIRFPAHPPRIFQPKDRDWLVGEAITNLYVGVGRDRRGEKLSAMRFIQSYAIDRIIELAEFIEEPSRSSPDPFSSERRFEQRFPLISKELGDFLPGYTENIAAALAILAFLEKHFDVNPGMADAIRKLCLHSKI